MQPDSYDSMAKALANVGLVAQKQNENQLVVSCQECAVWPNRGNSFWLSRKEGVWYLSTWLPAGYEVPSDRDIVALCSACMVGPSAMYRVPAGLVTQFQLRELDEDEYERLFPSG
jgi:hypothetical protein